MHPTRGQPEDDAISRAIQSLNQGGMTQPVAVAPHPSGWRCPTCKQEADQRIDAAPGTILGYKLMRIKDTAPMQDADERPSPLSVFCPEVTKKAEDGTPTEITLTVHCLNCFNAWQRRKMMQEIRANVPQLVYQPENEGG